MPKNVWSPQPGPQGAAIRSGPSVDELFFGGAAGGGKSDFLLGDFLTDVDQGSSWQGVLFRQSHPALEELVMRSQQFYPHLGGDFKVGSSQWIFPGGSVLKFRHFETVFDFVKYQGWSLAWIGWDELPEWSDLSCYNRMKSRLRGPARNKRIRATGNPGGAGHRAVQDYFKIPSRPIPLDEVEPFVDPETSMVRCFIPSRVQDNRKLLDVDPDYVQRLKGVGDPELVKAWLDGDWNSLVGAFFPWSSLKVEVAPGQEDEVPGNWPLFVALDYGESSPTCALLMATDYDDRVWVVGEYYQEDRYAEEHAVGIMDMIQGNAWTGGRYPDRIYAPHDMFIRRRLDEDRPNTAADIFTEAGLYLTPTSSDHKAVVNRWRVTKNALTRGDLRVYRSQCPNLCRTIPILQRDPRKPELIKPKSEDHAADALGLGMLYEYAGSPLTQPEQGGPFQARNVLSSIEEKDTTNKRYG